MNTGWIKLHRKFIDWEWYDDIKTKTVFIHCLLKANHKKKRWRGEEIERGSFITSYSNLARETGLSVQNVRTAIDKLEETGEINKRSTSVNTTISITYYDKYQSTNKEVTKEQQGSNKVVTTTKNEKNVKNDKKYTIGDSEKLKDNQDISHTSFVDKFNELYGRQLRVTDKKREMIRGRLRTFTGQEILKAWKNRLKDDWLNSSEGKEYLGDWKAAMRNDEKVERYLHKQNGQTGLGDNSKFRRI